MQLVALFFALLTVSASAFTKYMVPDWPSYGDPVHCIIQVCGINFQSHIDCVGKTDASWYTVETQKAVFSHCTTHLV